MTAGAKTTKALIWDAATDLFSRDGYSTTTVRDIATAAGVDPALVMRHFGSKEALFLDTMSAVLDQQPVFMGPTETLGADLIEFLLGSGEQVRGVFLALVRASDGDAIRPRLRIHHNNAFVAPLRARLSGADVELRARLGASLVGGLLYTLWVVEDEELQSAGSSEIVRVYGPLLQELITPRSASAHA